MSKDYKISSQSCCTSLLGIVLAMTCANKKTYRGKTYRASFQLFFRRVSRRSPPYPVQKVQYRQNPQTVQLYRRTGRKCRYLRTLDISEVLLLDSGATHHFVHKCTYLRNMRFSHVDCITLGGERHHVHGEGALLLHSPDTEQKMLLRPCSAITNHWWFGDSNNLAILGNHTITWQYLAILSCQNLGNIWQYCFVKIFAIFGNIWQYVAILSC
jgi:hypothetical protein